MTEQDKEIDSIFQAYKESPIVLPILFERLMKSEGLVWFSAYGQNDTTSDAKLEMMEIFVAPQVPSYDPKDLQSHLDGLIKDLKPAWVLEAKDLGILGLRPAGAQFRELLKFNDPVKPSIRYTTIKVVPHVHLAEVLNSYTRERLRKQNIFVSRVSELLHNMDHQVLSSIFGKEHELVKWAKEHVAEILRKKEIGDSKG